MIETMARHVPWGLVVAMSASLTLGLGCDSCPDLWYQAFEFEVFGDDRTHIFLTATEESTGEIPCNDRALAESCLAGPGTYHLSFERQSNIIGELSGVCTLGDQTDCAAEDAEAQGPPPLVRVERDSTTGDWNVTLEREGPCPQ